MDDEEWREECIKLSDKSWRATQAWHRALAAPPGTIADDAIRKLEEEALKALREVENHLEIRPT